MDKLRWCALLLLLLLPFQLGAWNIASPGSGNPKIYYTAPISGTGGADAGGIAYTFEFWSSSDVQISSGTGTSGGPPGSGGTWAKQLNPTTGNPACATRSR